MTYRGSDELKLLRSFVSEWNDAISSASGNTSADPFSSIVGKLFDSAAYDDRLSSDENWSAFVDAMTAKVETLRNFGFEFDSLLRSRLFNAEERAFAAMHSVDDFMGKRDIVGYMQRERAAMSGDESQSVRNLLKSAMEISACFDDGSDCTDLIRRCAAASYSVLCGQMDADLERRLTYLQGVYLEKRGELREFMWLCVTGITPAWQVGDEVQAATVAEICRDVVDRLEPLLQEAWRYVRAYEDNKSARMWESFLCDLVRPLRSSSPDLEAAGRVISEADESLNVGDRLALPLQRLARAGMDVAPHEGNQPTIPA